jgi:hypothetical protein
MVTVNVQDFNLTCTSPIPVAQGGSGSSTCTVTAVGGFTGTVNLTATATSGLTATLNPTSVSNSGSSNLSVTASTTATSGNVNVTGTSGTISHQSTVVVTVSSATTPPPQISQATWNHRFSLARYNNVQTFKLGAFNPSNVTEYISIRVDASDGTGVAGFSLRSDVIALGPLQNVNHVFLTQTFSPSQVGETFTFNVSIQWGLTATTDPSQLPFNSTASINGAPTSGSFTVLP